MANNAETIKRNLYEELEKATSLCDLMRFQREVACEAGKFIDQYFFSLAKTSYEWVTQNYSDPDKRENVIFKADGSVYVGPEQMETVSKEEVERNEKEEKKWLDKIKAIEMMEVDEDSEDESDPLYLPGDEDL